jgi:putative MATE family efflux protein
METIQKENKMGIMSIPKLLFSISIPIIISMLVQALYNVIDSVFVAWYDGEAGTGALTVAFPIQNLMIATATGLAVGINALLSRSLGQKNIKRANLIAGQGFFLMFCGYLLFLVFGLFFVPAFVGMQSEVGSKTYDFGINYLTVVCIGSIGVFIQVISERLLQATGKSLLSMITQLSGAIVNIILDPIMIFGLLGCPEMGVKGAAIATVIGQAVAATVGIILNLLYNSEIRIAIKNFIPRFKLIGEILVIGIPAVLMQAIGSIMTFSMNNILYKFSDDALNVFGIYFKLQSFVFMPVFGLNNGMIPIISYNYGTKKPSRVFATTRLGVLTAVSYMLFGFVLFQTIPKQLLGLFNATDTMLSIGIPALRTISISFLMAGFSVICIATCQALGNSFYSLIVSVVRQLVVLIPSAFLLALTGKVTAVWWAFPIAESVGCTLCIIFLLCAIKKAFGKDAPKLLFKIKQD